MRTKVGHLKMVLDHDAIVLLLVISMVFGPQKYGFTVESCDDFERYNREIVMKKLVELLEVQQWL